jgi:hypothetical protein
MLRANIRMTSLQILLRPADTDRHFLRSSALSRSRRAAGCSRKVVAVEAGRSVFELFAVSCGSLGRPLVQGALGQNGAVAVIRRYLPSASFPQPTSSFPQ